MQPVRPSFWLLFLSGICAMSGCQKGSISPIASGGTGDGVETPAIAAGGAWTTLHDERSPDAAVPKPAEDCAIAYDSTRRMVYIYGGKGDDDKVTNELWALDTSTLQWSSLSGDGPAPPAREDHSLVFDQANDALVVYGGEDGPTSSETWRFDLAQGKWQNITTESAPERQDHVAIYDPLGKRMVVFGGDDARRRPTADTWALNLDRDSLGYYTWTLLSEGKPGPAVRRQHAGVYDASAHRLLIFGGRTREQGKKKFLNDLWSLDLDTLRWDEVETSGEAPGPLNQAALTLNPGTNEVTLFGGELVTYVSGDRMEFLINRFWILDLNSLVWADRSPYPRPVYDHAAVFVPELGGTVVYGGSSYRPTKEHTTWLLDVSDDK